ncbi:hypothetical protein XBKB1_3000004 [Xenorhabdus bovienii str. kraussei Becker Underwood]|uniref:Uncharacterized protein n=1 Tax=Xenorhabdus bovienii str. kraussei Becker Underwood TaxID=1398204 RepID=A0A077PVD5_XENBV|nr:hypothetical protein XBKB1_3000004 [Xenorhabdus bovienii str. kraussei Becker Underwood]
MSITLFLFLGGWYHSNVLLFFIDRYFITLLLYYSILVY